MELLVMIATAAEMGGALVRLQFVSISVAIENVLPATKLNRDEVAVTLTLPDVGTTLVLLNVQPVKLVTPA